MNSFSFNRIDVVDKLNQYASEASPAALRFLLEFIYETRWKFDELVVSPSLEDRFFFCPHSRRHSLVSYPGLIGLLRPHQ